MLHIYGRGASAHTPNLLFRKDPGKRVGPHTNYHPERICSLSIKPITLLIVCILIIIHLPLPLPECISFILRERNVGCKDNSKDIAIIWNKIYLTATALMLSFFSFLYTSKDIPSILSYPFCIYETKSHKTVQSNPRPILQCNYRGSTALFLSFYLSGHFITFTLLFWL